MSSKKQKIIGTFVPLSSLSSSELDDDDQGTIAAGIPFLDWLKKTRQSAWQILPLNETQLETKSKTKHVPSPYKGYGIGLSPKYLSSAFKNIIPSKKELNIFLNIHKNWITDYAFFCALRDKFGTDDWSKWDDPLRTRSEKAIKEWNEKLKKDIEEHILIQWRLHKEYDELKEATKKLGIVLIGDMPFYLSIKSPLVWVNQDIFRIEKDGSMDYVSGIPDYPSSHFGRQVWGHPLYRWGSEEDNLRILNFWKTRLEYASKLFDQIRIDHAKAFFEYAEICLKNEKKDKFVKGPGLQVMTKIVKICEGLNISIFAEDSGSNLGKLREAMRKQNIPGIKILRFAYNEKIDKLIESYSDIKSYPQNCVAYTTTHDTESLITYLSILSTEQKKLISKASGVRYDRSDKLFAKRLRDAVLKSPANVVIIPIQDWLMTADRINIPGTEKEIGDTNWQYKIGITVEKLPVKF